MERKPAPASVVEKEGRSNQNPDGFCLVREDVTSSIKEKLMTLPPEPTGYRIYKVPERLREANKEPFKPWVVSIGPFHHQDGRLQAMEDRKLRWFRDFFKENNNLLPIVDFIMRNESTIRQNYEDLGEISSKEFCEMILLDSIFIVGLLQERIPFEKEWTKSEIFHDMMLIENQVPLFVPRYIYTRYIDPRQSVQEFNEKVYAYFRQLGLVSTSRVPVADAERSESSQLPPVSQPESPTHFIDFLRRLYFTTLEQQTSGQSQGRCSWFFSCIDFSAANGDPGNTQNVQPRSTADRNPGNPQNVRPRSAADRDPENPQNDRPRSAADRDPETPPNIPLCSWFPLSGCTQRRQPGAFKSPRSAEELFEAGVKFKTGGEGPLNKIEFNFEEGELKIPTINVNVWTETFFRNLIAFEQCSRSETKYVSDYIVFMDSLINTSKDVDILEDAEIIKNSLNDSEKIADLINNLYEENKPERNSVYDEILKALNTYNKDPLHQWKAKWYKWKVMLKKQYFQSPWSAVSLIAATILLILTVIQATCSIISLPNLPK